MENFPKTCEMGAYVGERPSLMRSGVVEDMESVCSVLWSVLTFWNCLCCRGERGCGTVVSTLFLFNPWFPSLFSVACNFFQFNERSFSSILAGNYPIAWLRDARS